MRFIAEISPQDIKYIMMYIKYIMMYIKYIMMFLCFVLYVTGHIPTGHIVIGQM